MKKNPKIAHMSLFSTTVSFKEPVLGMNFRNYWRITISTDNGLVSSGEICFLPKFSVDTPGQVLEFFTKISQKWEGKEIPTVQDFFQNENLFSTKTAPASLSFAAEAALFVLCVRIHGWIETVFTPHEIPLCGFIPPFLVEDRGEWRRLVELGFTYFKCKVDKSSSKKLLKMVDWLMKVYPQQDFWFRLDANRGLTPQNWKQMASAWYQHPVEYWEEPLEIKEDIMELEKMHEELNVRYAIDENFRQYGFKNIMHGLDAIVIKPSIWQGFRKCYRDLEDLRLLHPEKKIVLSSSYEVSYGMLHMCLLHKLLGLQTHCGFDTLKMFTHTEQQEELSRSPLWQLVYEEGLGFSLRGKGL